MVIRTQRQPALRACQFVECAMSNRIDRLHPAVKHGVYSATALLPGESPAEFEKLHGSLIAEFAPCGVLEDDIVMTMARLVWRKQVSRRCALQNAFRRVERQSYMRSSRSISYF